MAKVTSVRTGTPEFPEIRAFYESNLHPNRLDFDDQNVYEYVFHAGRWAGTFQATQRPTQNFFVQCKPTSVTDLAAITSIWRPGPLAGKMHELYYDAKFNKPYDWGSPLVNETLADTYGCITGDAEVMTPNGTICLKDIVDNNLVGIEVISYNMMTQKFENDVVVAVKDSGIQDVYKLMTSEGELRLTGDHLVLTPRGWVRVDELRIGDDIISVKDV